MPRGEDLCDWDEYNPMLFLSRENQTDNLHTENAWERRVLRFYRNSNDSLIKFVSNFVNWVKVKSLQFCGSCHSLLRVTLKKAMTAPKSGIKDCPCKKEKLFCSTKKRFREL